MSLSSTPLSCEEPLQGCPSTLKRSSAYERSTDFGNVMFVHHRRPKKLDPKKACRNLVGIFVATELLHVIFTVAKKISWAECIPDDIQM